MQRSNGILEHHTCRFLAHGCRPQEHAVRKTAHDLNAHSVFWHRCAVKRNARAVKRHTQILASYPPFGVLKPLGSNPLPSQCSQVVTM